VECESGEGEGMDERVDKESVGTGERVVQHRLGTRPLRLDVCRLSLPIFLERWGWGAVVLRKPGSHVQTDGRPWPSALPRFISHNAAD
jgi:hypothetical protein